MAGQVPQRCPSNRDDLRVMLRDESYTRGHEAAVLASEKACTEAAIHEEDNVIVDDLA